MLTNGSNHYCGEQGDRYFRWQSNGGARDAAAVAPKFAPYIRPTDTVLDFGCGGGFLLSALTCARRIGVDLNPAARRSAAGLGIECHEELDQVPESSVEVAISHHALEHVPHPIGALAQLRSRIRPGGRLLLCVPIDDWRTQRVYDGNDIHHHLYTWTPQLLGNTLSEAGFTVLPSDIQVLHYAVHRIFAGLHGRLPRPAFRAICYAASIALRRRELFATPVSPDGAR